MHAGRRFQQSQMLIASKKNTMMSNLCGPNGFIDHHGIEGVKAYLQATAFGRDLQVTSTENIQYCAFQWFTSARLGLIDSVIVSIIICSGAAGHETASASQGSSEAARLCYGMRGQRRRGNAGRMSTAAGARVRMPVDECC